MKYVSICLLILVLAIPASAQAQEAKDPVPQPEKTVRLVWFPRFSPDGKWLLSAHGSWDAKEAGEVRIWNVKTGEAEQVVKHPRGVRSVAWGPKGRYFATGGYDGTLRFFATEGGKPLHEEALGASIEGVRISSDGDLLVTTHGSGDVRVRQLPPLEEATELASWAKMLVKRKELHQFRGAHKGGIWGMTLSPNGKLLATAGKDTLVRIYDLPGKKILQELPHPGETNGVVFTNDNKQLLTGCADALIRVFEVETGKPVGELKGHNNGSVTDLQFSSDGKLLASAGIDSTVRLWDTSDLKKPMLTKTLVQHENLAFGVAISPDDKLLASAGWDDKIVVFDLKKDEERWSWKR